MSFEQENSPFVSQLNLFSLFFSEEENMCHPRCEILRNISFVMDNRSDTTGVALTQSNFFKSILINKKKSSSWKYLTLLFFNKLSSPYFKTN